MQTTRIEVRTREVSSDSRLLAAAHQLGYPTLAACISTRLFFVRGDLSEADANALAASLLADPVTETYALGATPAPDDAYLVERTLLPGVTDPVADSLIHAVALTGITLEQAATGDRYELYGDLTQEQVERIARGVLANTVIHRLSIGSPISAPFVAPQPPDATVEVISVRGLSDDALIALSGERRLSLDLNEMRAIRDYFTEMQRDPTDAELEMLAQTWSEHCVHKTFRAKITYTGPAHGAPADSEPITQEIDGLLKTYIRAATEKLAKLWVRSAFVDNAGVIAFDDEYDVAFKVETHNRPSALEPFGGANTGAGGVIRDVLGVSARPIANTDVLCFGMPDTPPESLPENVLHPRRIIDGVVHGIEDYGNKMGIPTVNGAIHYHPGYTANPLVFAGCVGIAPVGSHRAEAQPDDLIVVIGGRTGRDGLRGATFSSMEMDTTTAQLSGGAVQIGHPINEKQVLEVVLKARDAGLYTAITDCGAGGLSSAVGEMGKDLGARVQLADVPLKYPGLRPWEIWLSEAQERMVFAVPPANWEAFKAICDAHDVEAVSIGTYAPTGRLELFYGDDCVGDMSMAFLHEGLPRRELVAEWKGTPHPPTDAIYGVPTTRGEGKLQAILLQLLAHPTIRSKADVIHRYDHEVGTGTAVKPLVGPGAGPGDAAVIVPLDTLKPLTPQPPLPQGARGSNAEEDFERIDVPPHIFEAMIEIARRLRQEHTPSEAVLWNALRGRQLDGHKFRRQQPVGVFILDFYCSGARLAVEIDGPIHETQREADAERQSLLESLGIRFIRFTDVEVETQLADVLTKIRHVLSTPPSPLVGEGGEGSIQALALSVGMCPQYTALDPYAMAWAAVDEAVRNAVAVGADPDQIAILDNFSWGNTQLPDRLGALVRCAQGCHDAAVAYSTPFISGKDSLNNEYVGQDGQRHSIPGTLVISAIGIVPDANQTITSDFKDEDDVIYLVGETRDELGGSVYAETTGADGGTVPQPVKDAPANYRVLHQAIRAGYVTAAHDPSEGGLAVALAEMCIGGQVGAEIDISAMADDLDDLAVLFSESAGRLIVTVEPEDVEAFEMHLDAASVPFARIGVVGGEELRVAGRGNSWALDVGEMTETWGGERPLTPRPPLPRKRGEGEKRAVQGSTDTELPQQSDPANEKRAVQSPVDTKLPEEVRTEEGRVDEPEATTSNRRVERLHVPPHLLEIMVEIARKLRREPTKSEATLWDALRGGKLDGRKFRRQQNIGVFVVDFYCATENLAVEVDGGIHKTQQEADAQRQAILEELGIRFVRVSASDVENDLPRVLQTIRAAFFVNQQLVQTKPSRSSSTKQTFSAEEDTANTKSPLSPRARERGLGGEGRSSSRTAPPILILHATGSNRDRDAALACELAGGAPEIVTVNQLVRGERHVRDYAMLVIPGGFSYGDDLGAGVLWALDLRERIPGIEAFVQAGKPVLGICNGFQTLVKSGFLPGSEWDDGRRSITLTYNERGRFECRWVTLASNPASPCLFTEGLTMPIQCPVAHGEGRVMVADEDTRLRMWNDGLPALTYVGDGGNAEYPANPNGSVDHIAGLCNPVGNVFGLMPHPENHIFSWQHPQRLHAFDGLRLFENGIKRA